MYVVRTWESFCSSSSSSISSSSKIKLLTVQQFSHKSAAAVSVFINCYAVY
jgi:hypothetical protein